MRDLIGFENNRNGGNHGITETEHIKGILHVSCVVTCLCSNLQNYVIFFCIKL